jgi:hypothetical protein
MTENIEQIKNIELSNIKHYCINHDYYFMGKEGEEPYKLYAFLSHQYNDAIILDVGSYYGNSALAFSHNEKNTVISYDLSDSGQTKINKKNIIWKIKDFREDLDIDFTKVKIISIDVDPHDGNQEKEMVTFLKNIKWVGILIIDDIYLNQQMKNFWNSLTEFKKEDVTFVGHHTGTGIIYFS